MTAINATTPIERRILSADAMTPATRRIVKRLRKAARGGQIADVLQALFATYTETLCEGSVDFAQFSRNADAGRLALEVEGRVHFNRLS